MTNGKPLLLLLACYLLPGTVPAAAYDFYANTRYPGPGRRPDVDLYRVVQPGASDPRAYQRREVIWWPRKGVDIIEIRPEMPLRRWTWRRGPLDLAGAEGQCEPSVEHWQRLESPRNVGAFFCRQVRGYLHPPETGQYTLMLSADQRALLFLSSDEDPANKRLIAELSEPTAPERFDTCEAQVALPVRLEAGKRYYLELVHEEDRGDDHLEVAWQGPGFEEPTIVSGRFLSDLEGRRGRIQADRKPVAASGGRRPFGVPRQFEAHLIGFRGIGNTMSSKFSGDGGPPEPAVVLRLANGTKRCFPRGSFCETDKQFIMHLYVKEMNRIKVGLDKTPRIKPPSADIHWPNNARPGEPGTMQVESEHFIWLSGSQPGDENCPWVNDKEPDKAEWYRRGSIECAEAWWALNEYAGHLMPFWDRPRQFKYSITVPGTKRDGYQYISGYAGGGYGGCSIKAAGGGPWSMGLFHEWGHGALSNSWRLGGGEAQADAHQCLADPGVLKGNPQIRAPWRNIFNGGMGYGRTVFYTGVADDPNWGYNWFACLPSGVEENSIMQIVARVGQQRGLFANGIRGFGDLMGEYGARLATFDRELEDTFRRAYFAPARNWLEPVDLEKRIYRLPLDEAPEPFSVNIVRLVPDKGARKIVVDFLGLHDPDFYSDWRACIVAVAEDGTRRYSPLWNKGPMSLNCRPGDWSYWLTVAATPTAIYSGDALGYMYDGRFAYHYPWSIRLCGARPGTPRHCRADFNDAALIGRLTDSVPAPQDTEVGRRFLKNLRAFQKQLEELRAEAGDDASAGERLDGLLSQVDAEIDRMVNGTRHPNGGGWVQSSARVAPTAYVGPHAMVLEHARVLEHAIVEDYAVVAGDAVVSGHARVSGQAVVKGSVKLEGYSRTWKSLDGSGPAPLVPLRGRAKKLHQFGLFANYAMDRPENTILEDWYRFEGDSNDGYLYGRPTFVSEAGHKGFRFHGKTQYAELSPRVADLGEITVDISLKPEGGGPRTIFDFGASSESRLVLATDSDGRPRLTATVNGKRVLALEAKQQLRPRKWARLRVEIDGKRALLWIDGRKAAQKPTDFRPCDVFPPGKPKRNFIAASRDGSAGFEGVIDQVVIYHAVHEDFDALPPPTLDAPRRPTEDFLACLEKKHGAIAVLNAKADALAREMGEPYERLYAQCRAREQELLNRDAGYRKAVADLATAQRAADRRRQELAEEFDNLPENRQKRVELDEKRAQLDARRSKLREIERRCFEADGELVRLEKELQEAESQVRARESELARQFDQREDVVFQRETMAQLREEAARMREQVQTLEKQALQADRTLAAWYAQREEYENTCREREQALREQFESSPEVVALDAQIQEAARRAGDESLSQSDRDKAARAQRELRRKRDEMWNARLQADSRLVEAQSALSALRSPIQEREKAVIAGLHSTSQTVRKYDELNRRISELDRRLRDQANEFRTSDSTLHALNEKRDKLRQAVSARQAALRARLNASEPLVRKLKQAEQEYRDLEAAWRTARELYVAKGAAEAARKVAEAQKALQDATAKAWLPYEPEHAWLFSFVKQSTGGYYNSPYRTTSTCCERSCKPSPARPTGTPRWTGIGA